MHPANVPTHPGVTVLAATMLLGTVRAGEKAQVCEARTIDGIWNVVKVWFYDEGGSLRTLDEPRPVGFLY